MSATVYLDNNATTELSQEAAGVLMDMVLHNVYGNPSSQHALGIRLRQAIEAARYDVAESLGCSMQEIVFTSGGTEANNLAIRGVYDVCSTETDEIVVSAAEHPSVFNTVSFLADERVRQIPLLPDGSLDLEWAERLVTEDVAVVSVMLANNETGAIFPVKEIVRLAHKRGVLVHCDAVQAYGKISVNVEDLGVDMLSISGHKTHALPGVGALFVRSGMLLFPHITGGSQERGLRGGTENYYGIVSLGTVAKEVLRQDVMASGLRDAFELGIRRRIPDVLVNAAATARLPNTSSVTFKGIHASAMLGALAEIGVCASAGAACSSGSLRPSRVLTSMGLSDEEALSTVRFSFSRLSSLNDATIAIEACVKCVRALRQTDDAK